MESIQLKINLIQTLPATVQLEPAKTSKSEGIDGALIAIPISFLVVWAIAVSIVMGLPKGVRKQGFSFKPQTKVPCRNCQFFNCNPYLQCALHPSLVLTAQAAECSDYCARRESLKQK